MGKGIKGKEDGREWEPEMEGMPGKE